MTIIYTNFTISIHFQNKSHSFRILNVRLMCAVVRRPWPICDASMTRRAMDGPVPTGDQTPYGPEEHITGTLTMSVAAARASYCRSALIDRLCSAADKWRRLHMGMWAKIALPWSTFDLPQLFQIKNNNNLAIARLPRPGSFEMQNGSTLGLNIWTDLLH